ncbi:T9SS type A sorting domain-containing protein [Bacteroidales bacterium]|nr:T9SS type A sorting domain-containing protein [Bacteroidales bacterium]
MRKLNLMFISFVALLFSQVLLAVPDSVYNQLIITEARLDNRFKGYYEVTNVGDETIDLSNFAIQLIAEWEEFYVFPNAENPAEDTVLFVNDEALNEGKAIIMDGMLAPGESYTVYGSVDGYREALHTPVMSVDFLETADTVLAQADWGTSEIKAYNPKWSMYGIWDKPIAWDTNITDRDTTLTIDTTYSYQDTLVSSYIDTTLHLPAVSRADTMFVGSDTIVPYVADSTFVVDSVYTFTTNEHYDSTYAYDSTVVITVTATEVAERDSMPAVGGDALRVRNGEGPVLLQIFGDPADNNVVIIDACNVNINLDQRTGEGEENMGINLNDDGSIGAPQPVAGNILGSSEYTLVRKADVTHGVAHYDPGSSVTDSKWMIIPHEQGRWNIKTWTTVGHHGVATLDITSDVTGVTITPGTPGTITVPFGTERNDSVFNTINVGPGQAWQYIYSAEFADSLSQLVQDDDTLDIYVVGNSLELNRFIMQVGPAPATLAQLFPKSTIRYPNDGDEPGTTVRINDITFGVYVTKPWEAINGIDTVGNVNFGTTTDSLLNALEYAEGSDIEFMNDGRAFVMDGDKIKITSPDKSASKTYYIDVLPYEKGEVADLLSITWPDKLPGFVQGWGFEDTIADFLARKTRYTIEFAVGEINVPALAVTTADPNAIVTINRATTLTGTEADRTTTVKVVSEDMETDSVVVSIIFSIQNENKQLYVGEPFFSEFHAGHWWGSGATEICNPSETAIDFSQYMVMKSRLDDWVTALEEAYVADSGRGTWAGPNNAWDGRYRKYVMGYKYGTPTEWANVPGLLSPDNSVDPIIAPRDVKVYYAESTRNDLNYFDKVDVSFFANPTSIAEGLVTPFDAAGIHRWHNVGWPGMRTHVGWDKLWILKIVGDTPEAKDSIYAGEKAVNDPNDFEVIDAVGQPGTNWPLVDGRNLLAKNEEWVYRRKPHIYEPNPNALGTVAPAALTADEENCEYQLLNNLDGGAGLEDFADPVGGRNGCTSFLGTHEFTLPPVHLSNVVSNYYRVSLGYLPEHNLLIEGVSRLEDVQTFIGKLIKEHVDQQLSVVDASDNPKADDAAVTATDKLVVVSANGVNTSVYALAVDAIFGDVLIESDEYTITLDGENGKIAGIPQGSNLEEIRWDNITIPGDEGTTKVSILDADGQLVPVYSQPEGTEFAADKLPTIATETMTIEVVAEDGTKAIYSLEFEADLSAAVLYSDVYEIAEEAGVLLINNVKVYNGITVQIFVADLIPSVGATIKVKDRLGLERTEGTIVESDYVEVTSEDGSVVNNYLLDPEYVVAVKEIAETSASFSIYPNPTSDVINLTDVEAGSIINVTSVTGQVMMTQEVKDNKPVSVKHLPNGVYVLTVNNESVTFIKK